MLQPNIALAIGRQVKASKEWRHCLTSDKIIESSFVSNKTSEITYLFPLYIYQEEEKDHRKTGSTLMMIFDETSPYRTRKANIEQKFYEKLQSLYKQKITPEDILYYIYGIFYSNIYRETYAEFLRIDFPRIPFTANYELFKVMGKYGKALGDLHLLKSPMLDSPISKYQGGSANDRIEKITYKEDEQRIYINKDKYFEGVPPEVWNYHIGGYQVLHKYLKDRKSRIMDDAPRYCRVITAIEKTIEIQKEIDEIYPEIEMEFRQQD